MFEHLWHHPAGFGRRCRVIWCCFSFFFCSLLFGLNCLFSFFPLCSWHKTHMWARGNVSIFKTSSEEFWRTVRSRRSEQKAASLSHSFCFWALILWGSSSSVWWSYLICTGLVSGGHTGWLRHSCCYGNLVAQGESLGIWFQEKLKEM